MFLCASRVLDSSAARHCLAHYANRPGALPSQARPGLHGDPRFHQRGSRARPGRPAVWCRRGGAPADLGITHDGPRAGRQP